MTVELITRYVKILIGFVLVWGALWFFNNFGCKVVGGEMAPAINAESRVWTDPKTRHPEELKRDDVVLYTYDLGAKGGLRDVAARVIGLPGDKVKIVKGDVLVNNSKVGTADKKSAAENYAEIIVPRETVFVLCDNRTQKTLDSRAVGPIGTWAILGKVR
jgi:signal peptidase I